MNYSSPQSLAGQLTMGKRRKIIMALGQQPRPALQQKSGCGQCWVLTRRILGTMEHAFLGMIGRFVSAGGLTTPQKTSAEGSSRPDVRSNKKPGQSICRVIFRIDIFIRIRSVESFPGAGGPTFFILPPSHFP